LVGSGAGGSLAAAGCNLGQGFADFGKDLAEPEMVIIDGPGTKIADGQLSGMLVDPWGDRGAVVVGFRYKDDVPQLRMQPFDGGEGCNVGRAYRCIVFNRLPNEPQLIAYLDAIGEDGRGTLNFTDHACNPVFDGGIEDAELPERLFDSPPGFVVRSGSQLLDIDPYRKKKRVIADNVSYWSGPGNAESAAPIWYLADGQLVVMDETRVERLRLGKDVSEVVFNPSGDYLRDNLYLVDGGKLDVYNLKTQETPTTIAENVCRASLSTYGVTYYSPCAESQLIIQGTDAQSPYRFVVDSGVKSLLFAQIRSTTEAGFELEAVYTKASSVSENSADDLWIKQGDSAPRVWQYGLGRFISATTGSDPTLVAIVDSDGDDGRLIRVDSEGEKTLCTGVSLAYGVEPSADGWLLLTDVTDGVGKLTLVSSTGEKTTIIERFPLTTKIKTPERDPSFTGVTDARYYDLRAFLSDRNGNVGTITVLDRADFRRPLTLGNRVPLDRFGFFRNMTAIGYIDNYNPQTDTGALTVYQTRHGASSVVAKDVYEFSELLWPYEGVIYSVKKDGKDSIWAARAKP
ncbi:MAG TPA: hypothetical protein VKP30_33895, partial [Polyangiaceae bacterium]|nr:hypothetical protein [Polyangiaceae bacterium]